MGRSTVSSAQLRCAARASCPTGLSHSRSPVPAPVTATARAVSAGTVVRTSHTAEATSASLRYRRAAGEDGLFSRKLSVDKLCAAPRCYKRHARTASLQLRRSSARGSRRPASTLGALSNLPAPSQGTEEQLCRVKADSLSGRSHPRRVTPGCVPVLIQGVCLRCLAPHAAAARLSGGSPCRGQHMLSLPAACCLLRAPRAVRRCARGHGHCVVLIWVKALLLIVRVRIRLVADVAAAEKHRRRPRARRRAACPSVPPLQGAAALRAGVRCLRLEKAQQGGVDVAGVGCAAQFACWTQPLCVPCVQATASTLHRSTGCVPAGHSADSTPGTSAAAPVYRPGAERRRARPSERPTLPGRGAGERASSGSHAALGKFARQLGQRVCSGSKGAAERRERHCQRRSRVAVQWMLQIGYYRFPAQLG